MTPRRERLDRLLVARGLAPTRSKAQALLMAGRVRAGGVVLDKPGALVDAAVSLEIEAGARYVGRGGHKLEGALAELALPVEGRFAMDVGASTGGFTEVLLERGAAAVVALDVGRGQLDWGLRNDPRVVPIEGLNARYLQPTDLPWVPALAVVDVSFISLRLVLPPVLSCLSPLGDVVALIKPQFEVGRRKVGRGGIVRDPQLHRELLTAFTAFATESGWGPAALLASPITGANGNREFFVHLRPGRDGLGPAELVRAIEACAGVPAPGNDPGPDG